MTVIDTPAGINMWVLLSRRGQIQLHLKGMTVKGLAACLRREFPDNGSRFVKDYVTDVEMAISLAGGNVDYRLVNVHIMEIMPNGLRKDMGIFNNMDEVEANAGAVALYMAGRLEIVFTEEDARTLNDGLFFLPA